MGKRRQICRAGFLGLILLCSGPAIYGQLGSSSDPEPSQVTVEEGMDQDSMMNLIEAAASGSLGAASSYRTGEPGGEASFDGVPNGSDFHEEAPREGFGESEEIADPPMSAANRRGLQETPVRFVAVPKVSVVHYSHEAAHLTCAVGFVCSIAFDEGEKILSRAIGDKPGWFYLEDTFGNKHSGIEKITVRPLFWGLSTNLHVFTDRRAYRIFLNSPMKPEKGDRVEYTDLLDFTYPTEPGFHVAPKKKPEPVESSNDLSNILPLLLPKAEQTVPGAEIRFRYALTEPKSSRKRFAWARRGVSAFDDGERLEIRLPRSLLQGSVPNVVAYDDFGVETTANAVYEVRFGHPTWIIPSLPKRVEVFVGKKKERKSFFLERKPHE